MHALEVLTRLESFGVTVMASEGMVHVSPRAAVTDEVRDLVRTHKPALLSLLTRRPVPVPPLPEADAEAITEATDECVAIRKFEAGESRTAAERAARSAMRVYRVLVAMGDDAPARWLTMLAPGCDLDQATADACGRFGPDRVLEIHEYQRATP
ncbi:MAG: hypothetical protein JZU52_18995 [Lamprocystis purpurea]|nr:hypothetical protein [Lamprocystis purpurea]